MREDASSIVQFVGPWDGPLVATSVHAGHSVRAALAEEMVLDEADRLREEDPYTDRIAAVVESRMITHRSRFEVDLNRPRREAVYRKPDDCWGLEVWRGGTLADDLVDGSLAAYDTVYAELGKRLDVLAERGPFVLLDVHSYNHRRDGAGGEPAPQEENPDINVGTGSVDRDTFGPLVDRFISEISAHTISGQPIDVRENVAFEGRGLAWFVHDRYPRRGVVLALEFKKIWMDEWTGEVDADRLGECSAALRATLPGLVEEVQRPA